MKKRPHKFKAVANGTSSYDFAIYCEYCGLVVFHANRSDDRDKQWEKAKEGCPLAPEPEQRRDDPFSPYRPPIARFSEHENQ